jgi:uracil-DNA glycosylase
MNIDGPAAPGKGDRDRLSRATRGVMHHSNEEARFRSIFRRAHAAHAACSGDEWLTAPCRGPSGSPAPRPLVWSRRNGPWQRVPILWVGAAPGHAGGLGSGALGAHGTRIPFGGDVAGGNLDVLLSSIGVDRNATYITATLNQLPERGGGEPTTREIAAPVGGYTDSIALLRDTIIAAGPRLVVALGNGALRAVAAAIKRDNGSPLRLPTTARLAAAGLKRGTPARWPADALPIAADFAADWHAVWAEDDVAFHVLPLLHPSAQNMSPFAGTNTVFHRRMLETRDALRRGAWQVLGIAPPGERPPPPETGIYALREWRELVGPAHRRYDELWRRHGV